MMDFDVAIREPHDLTCDRLVAFCQRVGLTVADDTCGTLPLSDVVKVGKSRNYLTALDHLRCRIGVYAFQLCGCVIYVGQSTKSTGDWNLRKRVAQHLTEKNKGGTLRINWFRRCGCDFATYKAELARCCLWTVSFPRGDADIQKIAQLEHLLIGLLGPKYCDVPAT